LPGLLLVGFLLGGTEEMNEQVRLRLITQNARLVDARKETGMTQPAMARAIGMSPGRLLAIENLKVIPKEEELVKIACHLEKPIDYLFPEELMTAVEARVFSRRKVELSAPEVMSLIEAQDLRLLTEGGLDEIDQKVDHEILAEKMALVLRTLKPKEQIVLRLRYGLNGGEPRTLREVGGELHLAGSRIGQIEGRALRRLRHPSRSRKLMDFVGD
jgi:DNA-directed RNA polymerase sigma subunit (sigma70/sigma32)